MTLSTVWSHCAPSVRRAFTAAARRADRADTRVLLGALASITPVREGGDILDDLGREPSVNLPAVSDPGAAPDEPPEVELSPAVRETLKFFRYHRLRPVSPVRLAVRLLEISAGETVKSLEAAGRLQPYLGRLREFDASSTED